MITVLLATGSLLVWENGSAEIVTSDTGEEARLRKLLSKPATVRRSVTGDDGLIGEEFVSIGPGSVEHFRGVAQSISGARLIIDDDS